MFSKGEMQKISLARVLLRKPSIIILDEPFSFVDQSSIQDILQTLKGINKEGKAIIIISHDVFVEKFADDVISL